LQIQQPFKQRPFNVHRICLAIYVETHPGYSEMLRIKNNHLSLFGKMPIYFQESAFLMLFDGLLHGHAETKNEHFAKN